MCLEQAEAGKAGGRWEVGGRKWEVGVMRGEGVVTHS